MDIIPPTFVIDKSVEIMENFVAQPAEENVLYVSFKEKLEKAEAISETQRAAFLEQAREQIETVVYPAYQGYVDYFTGLRESSTTDAGVWKLPDGEAFYNYMLRNSTTTNMTADEIHALGLAEVDRIQAEMLAIFRGLRQDHRRDRSRHVGGVQHDAEGRRRGSSRAGVQREDGAGCLLQRTVTGRQPAGHLLREPLRHQGDAEIRYANACVP
jgi:uncharacterized protein (DUF885 family)